MDIEVLPILKFDIEGRTTILNEIKAEKAALLFQNLPDLEIRSAVRLELDASIKWALMGLSSVVHEISKHGRT